MKKHSFNFFQFGYCLFSFIALISVCDLANIFNKYSESEYTIIETVAHFVTNIIILFLYRVYSKMKKENEQLRKKNDIYIKIIDQHIENTK